MIAIAKSSPTISTAIPPEPEFGWRDRFACMLPAICRHARMSFRNLPAEARLDAVQEVVASAFVAYARLVKLGNEELAYATPLARFAERRVRAGRTVGAPVNVNDITSPWCQLRRGICVESLEQQDGRGCARSWSRTGMPHRPTLPPRESILMTGSANLPPRQRAIAEILATGEETRTVARRFGLSAGRVSQIRRKLHRRWCLFQGEIASSVQCDLACLNRSIRRRAGAMTWPASV